METRIHDAIYREETINEFVFNPMIEALPPPFKPAVAVDKLMRRPSYSSEERKEPSEIRLILTQRIITIHQPMVWEIDVLSRIDRCIRWGYVGRNPLLSSYACQLAAGHDAAVNGLDLDHAGVYHPNTYGFSILGISGIGKSSTIEGILSLYPQVIRHTEYNGLPLNMHQITWLKLDCPCDGSLKGLCLDFFHTIDDLIGTSYCTQYSKNATLDRMMIAMSQLCTTHNVGLLVVDEIQHLCTAPKGIPEKVLNFLVTLVNTIGVPVVTIGTPKAISMMQTEFQQAKRGSGQGDALLSRMSNDAHWDFFCKVIWDFQYTQQEVPYTQKMRNALYEDAQGIPFLAVHIYKLVQEDAILTERETFTVKDLHRIASEKMGLTKPMREAMKAGKEVDLRQFVDIASFSCKDYSDNYSIAAEAASPAPAPERKQSVQEAAIMTLLGLGLSYTEAQTFACMAIAADNSGCPAPTVVARNAWQLYQEHPQAPQENTGSISGLLGYEAIREAGLVDNAL